MSRVVADDGAQAPLQIADCAGADAGALRQLLLRHPGRQAQLLERGGQRLVDLLFHVQSLLRGLNVTLFGDQSGGLVSWWRAVARAMIGLESEAAMRREEMDVLEKETQNKQIVVRLFEEVVNEGRLEVL